MNLLALGCSHRTAPIEVRERFSFGPDKLARALRLLADRFGGEAVILSTCNRVELYLGHAPDRPGAAPVTGDELARFFAEVHDTPPDRALPHLYTHHQLDAVRHLFRVAGSLDSMVLGEGQIAGQVRRAYEQAQQHGSVGTLLHGLFQHAGRVAGRVRTETGIARGRVSVSSVAVEFVRQVFDHFDDKTVLVIGAGKMGELTLRHLRELRPRRILVTNRSPEKAASVAAGCGGEARPWAQLDDLLAQVDIVLSTTGAPEPVVTLERYRPIRARRMRGPVVILDIANPRDFDPRIHDGDGTCLFNIDDLHRIRDATLADRLAHAPAAAAIVEEEARRFVADWARRRNGAVIARLTADFEAKRREVVQGLLARLNGRLSAEDRAQIEGAFRLLQNRFLNGPISALKEESQAADAHAGPSLLDALRKLFRLHD